MVDRQPCGKYSKQFPSGESSSAASEFDEDRLLQLEGKYLENGLQVRPPSGTNHQQPGSHLSIDTRLSELSLGAADDYNEISNGLFYQPTFVNASSKNKHRVQVNKPNCYITSPFKQGYQVPRKGHCKVVDPSYELKNVTKESIARVRQQFRKPKPPSQPSHYTQRLRKARLRTTGRPFSGSGPTIKDCKGIQSGVQVIHSSGPSVLYSSMGSPSLRPQSPTELLRPDSSIHCPSRASIEDSVSEDSCEADSAVDSCINAYSNFERINSTVGEDHAQMTVGDQDIIDPKKDSDVQQKIELEIPEHDAVPGVDEENPSSLSEEECSPKSLEKSQRQNEKESNALKNNQKYDKNHKTQSCDGCKPFHDNDDDDDDDDDNQRKPQSIYHSNRLGSEGGQNANCNVQRVNEDESKSSDKQSTSCSDAEPWSSVVYGSSQRSESNVGHDVIIDSPIMTVHVREKDTTENAGDNNYSAKNSLEKEASHLGNTRSDFVDDVPSLGRNDDYLVDDLDTDRIPSAQIWKHLDQLNLSMNAYHTRLESDNNHLDFHVKTRKVQSAGAQRKPRNLNTSEPKSNSCKVKQRSRASPAKQKGKNDSETMIDKAEELRKYLAEESRRFSVDLRSKLPGYFMEQFDIIQQGKFGNASLESDDVQEILGKPLVKCQEEETESKCSTEEKMQSQLNRRESDSVLWACKDFQTNQIVEPYSDLASLGVFFTIDSTTCTEMESMSERTEDQSESREFSDDTGFETMAGSAKVHRDTLSDDEKSPLQAHDYRRENIYEREKLQVIAKAKHLTDPSSSNKNPLPAPHQPLMFYINAKPPTGYLFYFAYGVDMNIKRMAIYLRREHKRRWGVLFGFRLRFNKKGSSSDAGGFANVEFSAGSSVEGCVYTLTDAELSMLDNCMGYPKHYSRAVVPVWMCNSYQPSLHGVAQYCIPAVLYIADQQWVQPDSADCLDSSYSVRQCLKAADILTPSYVEYLNHLTITTRI